MLKAIRRTSLRTRLAMLAAFAIVALMVASFVAWRLARTTETFAVRQAENSVRSAANDPGVPDSEVRPTGLTGRRTGLGAIASALRRFGRSLQGIRRPALFGLYALAA